ncbi:MAG: hypothetical protein ACSLE5_00605 [Porticoccaceae bacterium]
MTGQECNSEPANGKPTYAIKKRRWLLACAAIVLLSAGCGDGDDASSKGLLDTEGTRDDYLVQYLVPGSDFLSIHGLAFDRDDKLYVASVMGQAIYQVDTSTGASKVFVGPPQGMADDLVFGPDGTLVWTGILTGKVYARRPDGAVVVLADNLPGINSVAFRKDGRLFVTQVLWFDALWELDPKGKFAPHKIAEKLGGLNGFDFDAKGYLYGPLIYKGQVVRVDVDSGEVTTVAAGFKLPVAVNFDSHDNLYVPDTMLGRIVRVDIRNGEKTLVATVDTGIDNLAINSRGELYITNMVDNAIYQIDTRTGAARTVVKSALSVPGGLDVISENGSDQVVLADLFAFRKIDGSSGAISEIQRGLRDRMEMPMSVIVQGSRAITTSWFTNAVEVVDLASNKSVAAYHGFQHPVDAIELEPDVLVVAEQGTGRVLKVSGDHGKKRKVVVDNLPGIAAMRPVPDEPDRVYITDVSKGQLLLVRVGSGKRTVIAEGLDHPEGFDVAPDGAIVLAEVGKRRIVRIDPDSGEISEIARNLAIGYPAAEGTPPGYVLTGVGVSPSTGAIYVSSDMNTALYKITPQASAGH